MSTLNIKNTLILAFFATLLSLASCSKDEPNTTISTGTMTLEFEAMANDTKLALNSPYNNTSNSESMSFSLFQYYVSNIVLTKTDGTKYTLPKNESYFLVKHDGSANPEITLKNIPVGDYNAVTFSIGVDSIANLSDPTTLPAALDVANGMHWSWAQGYVFLKAEGKVNTSTDFKYHLGLNSNLKSVTLASTSESATVRTNISPNIHLGVDIMKIFNNISVVTTPIAMSGTKLTAPSNNIPSMFTLEHIHN